MSVSVLEGSMKPQCQFQSCWVSLGQMNGLITGVMNYEQKMCNKSAFWGEKFPKHWKRELSNSDHEKLLRKDRSGMSLHKNLKSYYARQAHMSLCERIFGKMLLWSPHADKQAQPVVCNEAVRFSIFCIFLCKAKSLAEAWTSGEWIFARVRVGHWKRNTLTRLYNEFYSLKEN